VAHPSDSVAALHVQRLTGRDGPAALGVVGDA
jgi:hypothetical protein